MMSISDYFGDWKKVIDYDKLSSLITTLDSLYANNSICPHKSLVFKPFNLCPYSELKVVMIGANPYNIPDIGNGLLFGVNSNNGKTMPELEKIKKDIINYTLPHYGLTFDNTLVHWANQGCLLLNYGLTVETGSKNNHIELWKPFIISLLQRLSESNTGLIYVLFGDTAHTLASHIGLFNYLFYEEHPKDILKDSEKYTFKVFNEINELLKRNQNTAIKWYNEL